MQQIAKKLKRFYFFFFAVKGFNLNGEDYIKEAINNGASAIVCDKNCNFTNKTDQYDEKLKI